MAERIVITDPKLKEREEAAIADLKVLAFDDGVIENLDSRDKSLGKRLSKLYVRLGYASRREMVEAFGFTQVAGSKGGRPAGMTVSQYIDKLMELYPNGTLCASVGELKELLADEHPEMAKRLKTAQNNSKAEIGCTLVEALLPKGLLQDKPRKAPFDADSCEQVIDEFKSIYIDSEDHPSTAEELFDRHPEYNAMHKELVAYTKAAYGVGLSRYLKDLGIIQKDQYKVEAKLEELASQLDDVAYAIALKQADLTLNDRPKSMTALIERYPEYSDVLKKARNKHLLTLEYVAKKGLTRPFGAQKLAGYEQGAKRSVRNAQVSELVRVWDAAGLSRQIDQTGKGRRLLAPGIACIDLDAGSQDEVEIYSRVWRKSEDDGSRQDSILQEIGCEANDMDCEIISRQEFEDYELLQIRCTKSKPLTSATLIYALCKAGALIDADLGLADGWRIRYADALEG